MKRREFSSREREYWLNFLLSRDGYHCVLCSKDVHTLIRESKPDRQLPVLVIDHIDGDTRFTDTKSGIQGGNLRLLCYSCNRKNIRQTRPILPDRDRTPEQKKSEESKPIFYNWLNRMLVEYGNICYTMMLNRGSKVANDSSQVTVKRWFDQCFESFNGYEEFPLHEHGMTCSYGRCNGVHVCMYGELPRKEDVYSQLVRNESDQRYDDSSLT
jgi:hypothetical protein